MNRRFLRLRYPSFVDGADRVPIDPARVPATLREYIPFAEIWGVSDDCDRERLVARALKAAKDDLREVVGAIDDVLDDWLAGPAADDVPLSREYVAFSAMRMASDSI